MAKRTKQDVAVELVNSTPQEVEADLVLNDKPKLSMREKFMRVMKSQSGWLFVAPAVILMLIFTIYPIIQAFIGAFQQDYQQMSSDYNGWGFSNFVKVVTGGTGHEDGTFLQSLINTLIFTFISVPVSTVLALVISVALNSIKPLQKAYQTVLFLPYLTNSLAMGAVFATFFTIIGTQNNTETVGIVNNVLGYMGVAPIDWINGQEAWILGSVSIYWAKYIVMIIYEVWAGLPFKILILFSALQSVNKQYYDAARVDGASRSTILWKVTAPLISPQISYLLVTGIMGGMKQYTATVGIFDRTMGNHYEMQTMVGYIYSFINNGGYTGYAFAASLILFAIIMVITFINMRLSSKRVTY